MYLKPETTISNFSSVLIFLQTHTLGLLTTAIPLQGQPTIQASHLPFLYTPPPTLPSPTDTPSNASRKGTWSAQDLGTLRCHLARSNPQAKALLSLSAQVLEQQELLVVFSDPNNVQGYISPSWYKKTKPETGKVVPTWNYSELQLYGHPTIISPCEIVRELSEKHETQLARTLNKDEKDVWKVGDAPEKYIALLEKAIIGLEIKITRVGYKVKMSKEKPEGDREGVISGLISVGATEVAEMVRNAV